MSKSKKSDTKKRKSLFDHLIALTQTQDPDYFDKLSETDKTSWSNFMLMRFLSMNDKLQGLIFDLQPIVQDLPPDLFYRTFIGLITKGRYYSKYIKNNSDLQFETWLIELVSVEYQVSTRIAIEYLEVLYSTKMGRQTIQHICEKYGTDPKMIKKLRLNI